MQTFVDISWTVLPRIVYRLSKANIASMSLHWSLAIHLNESFRKLLDLFQSHSDDLGTRTESKDPGRQEMRSSNLTEQLICLVETLPAHFNYNLQPQLDL